MEALILGETHMVLVRNTQLLLLESASERNSYRLRTPQDQVLSTKEIYLSQRDKGQGIRDRGDRG